MPSEIGSAGNTQSRFSARFRQPCHAAAAGRNRYSAAPVIPRAPCSDTFQRTGTLRKRTGVAPARLWSGTLVPRHGVAEAAVFAL